MQMCHMRAGTHLLLLYITKFADCVKLSLKCLLKAYSQQLSVKLHNFYSQKYIQRKYSFVFCHLFFASTSWLHSELYCLSITNSNNKKTEACMLYSMYTTLAGSRSILHPHFSKFMIVMAYRDLILRPQPLMRS